MKHFLRFGSIFTMLAVGFTLNAFAATTDDATLGSIQEDVMNYLEMNHPDIEFGTQEYIEYISDVVMFDSDKELTELSNYEDIQFYCAEYLHELDEQQLNGDLKGDVPFIPSDDFSKRTIAEIQKEVEEKAKIDEIAYQQAKNSRPNMIASNYSASAAAKYAKSHATRYNPMFNAHSKDCTNFVSQCVEAGGIRMARPSSVSVGITNTTKYWYSDPIGINWGESSSWVNVDDFYTYCINKANADKYVFTSLSDLEKKVQVGDVVQIQMNGSNWYHSVIISDYNKSKGGYLYCGHSKNKLDEPISSLGSQTGYRIIRF